MNQPTKSKSLFELINESFIVTADYFCCIHIAQLSFQYVLKHLSTLNIFQQKLEILYEFEFDVLFRTIYHFYLLYKTHVIGGSYLLTTNNLLDFYHKQN